MLDSTNSLLAMVLPVRVKDDVTVTVLAPIIRLSVVTAVPVLVTFAKVQLPVIVAAPEPLNMSDRPFQLIGPLNVAAAPFSVTVAVLFVTTKFVAVEKFQFVPPPVQVIADEPSVSVRTLEFTDVKPNVLTVWPLVLSVPEVNVMSPEVVKVFVAPNVTVPAKPVSSVRAEIDTA